MNDLRIFLADDHAVVREGMKALINGQPTMTVVGEAADGETAVRLVQECNPDVVVMDISMPRLNGARATIAIKEVCPDCRVLALTMYEARSYLWELMNAGASGYILKRTASSELVHAIRIVANGGTYLDPALAGKVMESVLRSPAAGAPREEELSQREADVLRLIARGYSNKEIGEQLSISVKTVETYKARAMEKLELGSRVDIVRYALRRDWLSEP
jgi:DNA-binding NarL/FixJ family response regulator